jgi:four helix bundle protein
MVAAIAIARLVLPKTLNFRLGTPPALVWCMTTPFTYRSLDVWQLGMSLITDVYRITEQLPRSELYGLTAQIRRAAVSIPSNIAEGHCRRSTPAFANHVSIALGSHGELSTCVEASCNLGFIDAPTSSILIGQTERVGQMLYRLHDSLELRIAEQSRRR